MAKANMTIGLCNLFLSLISINNLISQSMRNWNIKTIKITLCEVFYHIHHNIISIL